MENYSKDLSHKSDIIKKLEQQLEALPILKNKVREMENMLSIETLKTSEPTTLRSYNRNSKDADSFAKVIAMGQTVIFFFIWDKGLKIYNRIFQVTENQGKIANLSWELLLKIS